MGLAGSVHLTEREEVEDGERRIQGRGSPEDVVAEV